MTRVPGAPTDRSTIEKGLRRLAARGSKPGGQYGRWLLRYFGVPLQTRRWVKWLGQYHSRFADLPTRLRLEQLRLWDGPPISESPQIAWIHLGLASVQLRMEQREQCEQHLAHALRVAPRAGPAAQMEATLLQALLRVEAGRHAEAEDDFATADSLLERGPLDAEDRACYRARLEGQRAYVQGRVGSAPDHDQALATLLRIPTDSGLPFVDFRRAEGLAYCHWKLGDLEQALALAREAAEHAADGGLVRFRIMALKLLSRMSEAPERERILARAQRLARLLEDEDLIRRTQPE